MTRTACNIRPNHTTVLSPVTGEGAFYSPSNPTYWIHAVEASPKPDQALQSADILGRLAPTSGHMVHVPGHIFYRTGDYARAEQSFAASMEADERYMQTYHVQVDDDGMQSVETHDLAKAEQASQRLDAELWRISQCLKDEDATKEKEKKKDEENEPKLKVMPDAWPKPLASNLSIMSLEPRHW